jgi:hypothetical protein
VKIKSILLGDDWGTLDFMQDSKASTSTTLEEEENLMKNINEADYEQLLNPKEMEKNYGKGYKFMKQLGYSGK